MKSTKRRFGKINKRNPYWSSLVSFNMAVVYQKFCRQAIHRWFPRLVEKEDYDRKDKKAILAYAEKLTNAPENYQK